MTKPIVLVKIKFKENILAEEKNQYAKVLEIILSDDYCPIIFTDIVDNIEFNILEHGTTKRN